MEMTQRGIIVIITSLVFLIHSVKPTSSSSFQRIIQITPQSGSLLSDGKIISNRRRGGVGVGVDLYCESWRFTVETNDAGSWDRIPARCVDFVREYITGGWYSAESEAVAENAIAYAKEVAANGLSGNGRDAWVFDIDETLLSNVPYYADHGFGAEIFDEPSFDEWVDKAEAPALSASLRLYKELQELGFTIFLLTGRSEFQRNATEANMLYAGYSNWKKLFLRGDNDHGKLATVYKSEKREEIADAGYIIRGNSGDQWSDLVGYAVAKRSFKLPNPLYFIA